MTRVPLYCPGSREALLDVANRLTMQARKAYAAGDVGQASMCGWMAMYMHYRALGHSKRNSEMRVFVLERRGEL